jgi:hypothetical protein
MPRSGSDPGGPRLSIPRVKCGQAPSTQFAASVDDDDPLSRVIHIQALNFIGMCARSPNKRFTLAWVDSGPDQARTGVG